MRATGTDNSRAEIPQVAPNAPGGPRTGDHWKGWWWGGWGGDRANGNSCSKAAPRAGENDTNRFTKSFAKRCNFQPIFVDSDGRNAEIVGGEKVTESLKIAVFQGKLSIRARSSIG